MVFSCLGRKEKVVAPQEVVKPAPPQVSNETFVKVMHEVGQLRRSWTESHSLVQEMSRLSIHKAPADERQWIELAHKQGITILELYQGAKRCGYTPISNSFLHALAADFRSRLEPANNDLAAGLKFREKALQEYHFHQMQFNDSELAELDNVWGFSNDTGATAKSSTEVLNRILGCILQGFTLKDKLWLLKYGKEHILLGLTPDYKLNDEKLRALLECLPNLKTLNLDNMEGITEKGFENGHQQLTHISLNGTTIPKEAVKKEKFPNIQEVVNNNPKTRFVLDENARELNVADYDVIDPNIDPKKFLRFIDEFIMSPSQERLRQMNKLNRCTLGDYVMAANRAWGQNKTELAHEILKSAPKGDSTYLLNELFESSSDTVRVGFLLVALQYLTCVCEDTKLEKYFGRLELRLSNDKNSELEIKGIIKQMIALINLFPEISFKYFLKGNHQERVVNEVLPFAIAAGFVKAINIAQEKGSTSHQEEIASILLMLSNLPRNSIPLYFKNMREEEFPQNLKESVVGRYLLNKDFERFRRRDGVRGSSLWNRWEMKREY